MKSCTEKEFNEAVAKAGWPTPRRMCGNRYYGAVYMDRGTEVASKHQDIKYGKVVSETYMANPDYFTPEKAKE